jgi:hypothetical protein
MHSITLPWIGGEHEFALRLGELRALQDKTDAGPLELMHRIVEGRWRVDDLIETLRLGLIGAGMERGEAGQLVTRLFERHPLTAFALPAQAVLIAALTGPPAEEDEPGKPEGVTPGAGTSGAGTVPVQ